MDKQRKVNEGRSDDNHVKIRHKCGVITATSRDAGRKCWINDTKRLIILQVFSKIYP